MQSQAGYWARHLKELAEERQRRLEEALKAGSLKAGFDDHGRLVVIATGPRVIRFPRKGE